MRTKAMVIFWSIVSLAIWLLFGSISGNYIYSFYFLMFFMPVIIITSYVFNEVIIPRYLLKKQYRAFFLYLFYLIIISLDIEWVMIFMAFVLISAYDYSNLPIIIDSYKWMPVLMYFIVILYSFIVVIRQVMNGTTDMQKTRDHFTVRSERKNRIILFNDVRYIESMSDYLKIILTNGEVVITRERISNLADALPDLFLRIHRSFIINRTFVTSYNREEVILDELSLPVSRTFKKSAMERLSEKVVV